ncbi:hypothetical protein M8J76_005346 [Diaphorina citri]|nr:hypothetical protein M8J75_008694 [Diaphorina citri]KAI5744806.1 hypothetical protein M8J76_005346 [Diaphorina citri]
MLICIARAFYRCLLDPISRSGSACHLCLSLRLKVRSPPCLTSWIYSKVKTDGALCDIVGMTETHWNIGGGAGVKMEHHFHVALDPRKQELLEARFSGARVSFHLYSDHLIMSSSL